METEESPKPVEDAAEKETGKYHPIRSLFLLDVLRDHDSRPVVVWALFTLLAGTLFYHFFEGWGYIDALYFCVVSLATVGYGDLTPTTPLTRLFTVFYLINGIGILLAVFDRIRILRTQQTKILLARRKGS